MGKIPDKEVDYPYWYKNRLDACDKCEHNSKNIPIGRLKPKIWFQTMLMRKHSCELCGCCIKEKCWMKTEICALAHNGERPKWNRLEVVTSDRRDFNVEVLDENMSVDISDDGSVYELNIYDIVVGDKIPIVLVIHHERPFYPEKSNLGCGCIGKVDFSSEPDEENNIYLRFELDSSGYQLGHFEKNMSLVGVFEKRKEQFAYFPLRIIGEANKPPK